MSKKEAKPKTKTKFGDVKDGRKIASIVLALFSALALVVSGLGVRDSLAIKEELEKVSFEESMAQLKTLEDGIAQLQDNETAYFDGVDELTAGKADYAQGQKDLAKGKSDLAQGYKDLAKGKSDLAAGQKAYDTGAKQLADGKKELKSGADQIAEGERQLAEGKKELAAGEKLLAENKQAYEDGKKQLAQIEPLMPYVNQYIRFRDGNLKALPGFDNAQAWFTTVVRPVAKRAGLDLPSDVRDFPGYVQKMVADGKAQLKEYEDGLKQVEEGRKQIAEGEATLAAAKKEYAAGEKQVADGEKELAAGKKELDKGYKDYADGKKQLADGEKQVAAGEVQLAEGAQSIQDGEMQLAEFEDGVQQVRDGLKEVMDLESIKSHKGKMIVKSPSDEYGKDIDLNAKNEDGTDKLMYNGKPMLDLDKAMKLAKSAINYANGNNDDATDEITSRILSYAGAALAGLLGLFAALRGMKNKGKLLATITAALGLGVNGYGIQNHYTDFHYLMPDGSYSGTLQFIGLALFGVAATLCALAFYFTKKKVPKESAADVPLSED